MKIVFMGTPAAAVPSLERIISDGHDVVGVYTQPDRPAGRGQRLHMSPVKELALARGLAVHQPTKLRIPETIEAFRAHDADVAVVVAYGRILPSEYLNAFSKGAINVHFSLLPKYRGAAPVNWAIAEGETRTGVTTMRMDEGLDTGDILLQWATCIGADENSIDLMSRLAELGGEILSDTLRDIRLIHPKPQNHAKATLAPILKKEDGNIDWAMEAKQIENRIRGFQPFPGTFTKFRGKSLKVWRACQPESYEASGQPGEIVATGPDGIIVRCGKGVLQLIQVQPEGKKPMTAQDFLNGTRVTVGEILGSR
jgi:methionyl-tRNA formyltransferase